MTVREEYDRLKAAETMIENLEERHSSLVEHVDRQFEHVDTRFTRVDDKLMEILIAVHRRDQQQADQPSSMLPRKLGAIAVGIGTAIGATISEVVRALMGGLGK